MKKRTKMGRPRKADGPKVPYDVVDRLLVYGEEVESQNGGVTLVYPSYREVADRFGVSNSLIAQYSKKHNCLRRRKQQEGRAKAKADKQLVEMRASSLAVSHDHALQIVDDYILQFEKALADGRVRTDSPGDLNTMIRLKKFLEGGPDSRQEIHATLSLEDLQARHRAMLKAQRCPVAERGLLGFAPESSDGGVIDVEEEEELDSAQSFVAE